MADLITEVLSWSGKLTVVGALVLFIVGLLSGRIRLPREVDEMQRQLNEVTKDRDEWKRIALSGHSMAKYAIRVADNSTAATKSPATEQRPKLPAPAPGPAPREPGPPPGGIPHGPKA